MATARLYTSNDTYDSGSTKTSWGLTYSCIYPTNIIPKHSIISAAYIEVEAAESLKSSKGDLKITVGNTSVYNKTDVVEYDYIKRTASFLSCLNTSGNSAGTLKDGSTSLKISVNMSSTWPRKFYQRYFKVYIDYTPPTYTLNVASNNSSYGSVSGGISNLIMDKEDHSTTITAIPNSGYKFVRWSDGDTNASRNITVNENSLTGNVTTVTLTAEFERNVFVSFDTMFSFTKWKESGITTSFGSNATLSVNNTGLSITSNWDNEVYTDVSPKIRVTPNTLYTFEVSSSGNAREFFVFYYTSESDVMWSGSFSTASESFSFETPASCNYIAIRCDSNSRNQTSTYSDFRLFPSYCPYMSYTVPADKRTNSNGYWVFPPDPIRSGYTFKGWFDSPVGGIKYTSNSAFPSSDLVLYSQWESDIINKIYIGSNKVRDIYIGSNKVRAVYVGTTKIYG